MKERGHKHIHMIKQLKVDANEDEEEESPWNIYRRRHIRLTWHSCRYCVDGNC